jgi:hypothetical protein
MTIRMTPRKLLKAAFKLFKTMAFGYAGAAVAGLALGIYGGLTGMTNAELMAAAMPVGIAGGLLTMTLALRPMASVRSRVRVAGNRR